MVTYRSCTAADMLMQRDLRNASNEQYSENAQCPARSVPERPTLHMLVVQNLSRYGQAGKENKSAQVLFQIPLIC